MSACRVLAQRIDWFSGAFKVALSEPMLRHFAARLAVAEDAERCAVLLAGSSFCLKRMRTGKRLLLQNATCSVVIDPDGPEGWTAVVEYSGSQMLGEDIDAAVETARRLARALGDVQGERVRRLDLCADIAGLDVAAIDGEAWVKPSRARMGRCTLASVDGQAASTTFPESIQYRRGKHVTGYHVCPGNPMQAVVYDKREELNVRPGKREAEEGIWTKAGWNGDESVGRVEFRFRAEVLHELGCRDGLDAFRQKLDAVWAYASRWWLRLVELGTHGRISCCKISPEWAVVQSVRFKHEAAPAERKRIRKGASPAQVFGACLSAVAGAALLLGVATCTDPQTGRVMGNEDIVARLSPAEQEATVRAMVSGITSEAGELVVVDLLERFGAGRACLWMLEREAAARARFAECAPAPAGLAKAGASSSRTVAA